MPSTTNLLPVPFSSQWRAGHWQASDYANLARGQRLARLNDVLGKAHDHHMAEKANDQPVLDELRATMNAPPYVSTAWVEEQLAAAPLPKKKKNKKKSKKAKKDKKDKKEEQEEDLSAVAPGALPEESAPVASPSESGAGLEAAAEKSGSSNSRFLQYMKLLVSSQKALPPPAPAETNFLREDVIGDTARAVTALAHDNEFPISNRAGDAVPIALVNIPQGSTIYQEHAWITLPLPLDPTIILAQYHALSAEDQSLYDSMGHNISADFMKRQLPTLKGTHPAAVDPNTKEHAIIATWLTHQDPGMRLPNAPTSYNRESRSIYPHLLHHVRQSCSPNCHLICDERYNALVLRSARAIPRGEPITYCPIADYTLFTHDARAIKLHDERGLPTCKCALCCPLLPAPPPSGSSTTDTSSKSKKKAKDTTTTNPDAIPLMKRIAIETRRQQTAHAWSAWRTLRDPFWSASSIAPLPPPTHPDHPVAAADRPSPPTVEALATALDELLVDAAAGGTVSPMQAWFRSDVSHAFQDVGDHRSARLWARRELEADALLLGLGHEGCEVTQMRIAQVTELEMAETLKRMVREIDQRADEAQEELLQVAEGGAEGGRMTETTDDIVSAGDVEARTVERAEEGQTGELAVGEQVEEGRGEQVVEQRE